MKTNSFFPTQLESRENAIQSFDSIFDKMFTNAFPDFSEEFGINLFERGSYPKVNVIDHDDKLVIIAEIAGMNKDDISIDYREGILTISGGKKLDTEKQAGKFLYKELKRSSFNRSFKIDADKFKHGEIDAKFENGLLNIEIPKQPAAEKDLVKKISIKIK